MERVPASGAPMKARRDGLRSQGSISFLLEEPKGIKRDKNRKTTAATTRRAATTANTTGPRRRRCRHQLDASAKSRDPKRRRRNGSGSGHACSSKPPSNTGAVTHRLLTQSPGRGSRAATGACRIVARFRRQSRKPSTRGARGNMARGSSATILLCSLPRGHQRRTSLASGLRTHPPFRMRARVVRE